MAKQITLDDGAYEAVKQALKAQADSITKELTDDKMAPGVRFYVDNTRKALNRAINKMRGAVTVAETDEAEAS